MTEVIFDLSNVRIFKDIEKKKIGDTLLCLRSTELSKAFGLTMLKDLCYSKISVVMLLGYRNAGISQNDKHMPFAQMLHIQIASVIYTPLTS